MKKNSKYYFPHYWPLWLFVFLFKLLILIPYKWQLFLGNFLGLIIMCIAKQSKHVAEVNIKICFPDKSDKACKKLLKENFKNIGIAVFETALGFWASNRRLKNLTHYHKITYLDKAIKNKKGVLLLGAHFTTIEIVGRICSMEYDFCVMYRPNKIGFVNYIIEKNLKKHYKMAIPNNDVRSMALALKKGYIVWYSGDVNPKRRKSVFAPFFNTLAATSKAPGRFVRMTNCNVLPVKHFRRKDNSGYDISLSPPLENFPSENDVQDATQTNQIIENAVRECPEQYLWQYKRFKTRPKKSDTKFY